MLLLDLHLLSDICQSNTDRYDINLSIFHLSDDTLKNASLYLHIRNQSCRVGVLYKKRERFVLAVITLLKFQF